MDTSQLDTQKIEIIGRSVLTIELMKAGFEVAEPIRDRGVDLILYLDINDDANVNQFISCPIQIKNASTRSFGIFKKYDKFRNLIIVHVWNILTNPEIYALTQTEAIDIATKLGWTNTSSWNDKGGYSTTSPSKELRTRLKIPIG